ncbi:hypothetical protein FACS1894109_12630 [Spirochaetia bacterium]|nr:hypothetical protein FACS1894109_12630 [Spirochaetia bacterium]
MAIKALDLFDAYNQNKLPKDQAYLVSSFVNINTGYTRYEIISYSGVKAIYTEGDGLTFQSQGKKLYILIEPASYPHKGTEPYLRPAGEQIPLRFKELEILTSKNQIKALIAKEPIESLTSFTVTKSRGFNISFVFFNHPDIYATMALFFERSFNQDGAIPQADAKKFAKEAATIIQKTMGFKNQYA